MITAKELKELAQAANKTKSEKIDSNTNLAIIHFIKIFEQKAKQGKFSCSLSNLLKRGNHYYCQTDSGG